MKKNLKFLLILLCFGCTSTKVFYDYDVKTDFSKYKSFLFYSDAGKGLSPLDAKRFKRAIVSELDSMGIRPSDYPNFYVNIVVEKVPVDQSNVGFDFIGGGRNIGVGMSTGTTIGNKKVREKVTIDFVDASNNSVVWKGEASDIVKERLKPLERVAYVEKMIKKILSAFPPK